MNDHRSNRAVEKAESIGLLSDCCSWKEAKGARIFHLAKVHEIIATASENEKQSRSLR
jgi:hypothetical protein